MYRLIQILNREVQLANIKQNIQIRTREDIDRQQREYFLQQQIKNIQDELGGGQEMRLMNCVRKANQKNGGKRWQHFLKKSCQS
jgi:ATP-dependent Lon protease